jgi:hypothetical protein
MDVIHRCHLQANVGEWERRRQLAPKIQRFGRGDLFVQRLQLLQRQPGPMAGVAPPTLDVLAEDGFRPQERREDRHMLRQLSADCLTNGTRDSPLRQQRLDVPSAHPWVSSSSRCCEACTVNKSGSAYRRGRGVSTNRRHEPIHVYVSWCAEDWARPTFRNRTVVLPGPREFGIARTYVSQIDVPSKANDVRG